MPTNQNVLHVPCPKVVAWQCHRFGGDSNVLRVWKSLPEMRQCYFCLWGDCCGMLDTILDSYQQMIQSSPRAEKVPSFPCRRLSLPQSNMSPQRMHDTAVPQLLGNEHAIHCSMNGGGPGVCEHMSVAYRVSYVCLAFFLTAGISRGAVKVEVGIRGQPVSGLWGKRPFRDTRICNSQQTPKTKSCVSQQHVINVQLNLRAKYEDFTEMGLFCRQGQAEISRKLGPIF